MSMCGPETPGDSCEAAKRPETPGRVRCLACAARRLRETPVSMCCPETPGDSWGSQRNAAEASVHTKSQPVKVRPWVFTSLGRSREEFCMHIGRLARQRLQRAHAREAVRS